MRENVLNLERLDNNSSELNLQGYFYDEFGETGNDLTIYFLYRNGIILYGSSTNYDELENLEKSFIDGSYYRVAKDTKYFWGTYEIVNSEIRFERWYPGDQPYKTFVREGVILDNESFHITKSYESDGSNIKERDELYRFKAFSDKPDSTNTFIE